MEVALSSHQNRADRASLKLIFIHPDIAQVMPENLLRLARPTVYCVAKDNLHPSLTHIAKCLVTPFYDSGCRDWSMGLKSFNPVQRDSHDQLLRYYV